MTPKPKLLVREIVSEYSVGTLKESDSADLVEFRQVVSVDGRRVQSAEHARHALSLGIQSPDDRVRKRMLEDFAQPRPGRRRHRLRPHPAGIHQAWSGEHAGEARRRNPRGRRTMRWSSRGGKPRRLAENWNSSAISPSRRPLQGMLYVRKSDGLPLRVQAWAEHPDAKRTIRDEAAVDYALSTHGFLMPASVVHRHLVDGELKTENLYRYEPFKLFSADAEIKFTEVPETPPPRRRRPRNDPYPLSCERKKRIMATDEHG